VAKQAFVIAEATASQSAASDSTLKQTPSGSWWKNLSISTKGFDSNRKTSQPAKRDTKG
jgi:hypothetical protein